MNKLVTLDTGVVAVPGLVDAGERLGHQFGVISVSEREVRGTQFQVSIAGKEVVPESFVWGESEWDEAVWPPDDCPLDRILLVISSNGFPEDRSQLTEGQLHQLRDAMILEAHIREKRDFFVSNDQRAFVKFDRREIFEKEFSIRIFTAQEYLEFCAHDHASKQIGT